MRKSTILTVGVVIILALAGLFVAGCPSTTTTTTTPKPSVTTSPTPTTPTTTTPTGLMGVALFDKQCVRCHGKAGMDNVPNPKAKQDKKIPGLRTRDFAKEFNTDAKIKDIIMKGSKVEGAKGVISMPSFKTKLTGAQVDSLVAYINTLKVK